VKGSSDAKKQVQKAHTQAHELENQVENIQLEIGCHGQFKGGVGNSNERDRKEDAQNGPLDSRLTMCIKWFQELEGDLLFEQEKHMRMLKSAEQKCCDTGLYFRCLSFHDDRFSNKNIPYSGIIDGMQVRELVDIVKSQVGYSGSGVWGRGAS
ncbi:hypothetical protein Tco_1289275, partial [Tanacetum coccineum]